jgi:Mor family transcriptional regulator
MISLLYAGFSVSSTPKSEKTPPKPERNELIRKRYAEGITGPELAKEFGLSRARIYQILGKRHNRKKK